MRLILGELSNPPVRTPQRFIPDKRSYKKENVQPGNSSSLQSQVSLSTVSQSQTKSLCYENALDAINFSICSASCPGDLRGLTCEEYKLLHAIFPGTKAIAVAPPYLVIRVGSLPTKPWPISIAGAPLFLTTSTDLGYLHQTSGTGQHILPGIRHSTHTHTEILMAIFQALCMAGLTVKSVTLYGAFVAVELIGDIDCSNLPSRIANIPAEYTMKTEFGVEIQPSDLTGILPNGFFDDIATADELKLGGDVNMKSRPNGYCDAKILGIQAHYNETESEKPRQDMKPTLLICYTFGNGQIKASTGWYGSPIIDESTNKVVSFVGTVKADGVGYGILTEEYVKQKMQI